LYSKLKTMNLNDAQTLAVNLMRQHGLTQLGWTFEYDRAVRRFGVCKYRPKVIGLSEHLVRLNGLTEVKDVILHEIAHALVGQGHGHNNVWKRKCIEIGAKPERCYDGDDVETPQLRYVAICGGCGKEHDRSKKLKDGVRSACHCQKHLPWDRKHILNYQDRFGGVRN
jgi:predicted SprT family Zn-dependent metalloprotease